MGFVFRTWDAKSTRRLPSGLHFLSAFGVMSLIGLEVTIHERHPKRTESYTLPDILSSQLCWSGHCFFSLHNDHEFETRVAWPGTSISGLREYNAGIILKRFPPNWIIGFLVVYEWLMYCLTVLPFFFQYLMNAWGEWIFSIYLILPAALGPEVHSAPNKNEYQPTNQPTNQLCGFSPRANYTDRATSACRRN
jgi:hypothetical protein